MLGDVREGACVAVERIFALPGRTRERVRHAREEIARDVLEVAAVPQPRSRRRDLVGGAFPSGLAQHRQIQVVGAVPRRERREQLQPITVGIERHLHRGAVLGRREVTGRAGIESSRRQIDSLR